MLWNPRHIAELERIAMDHWKPEVFRRFQCIWLSCVFNLSVNEIAEGLGLSLSTVRRIQGAFQKTGAKAIDGRGKHGGSRHHYMTIEEESAFLRQHAALFSALGMPNIGALKTAFEARVGHSVHKTTIYRMLARHGHHPLGKGRGGWGVRTEKELPMGRRKTRSALDRAKR